MKKNRSTTVLSIVLMTITVVTLIIYFYITNYTGTKYYTKINLDPKTGISFDSNGIKQGSEYTYRLKSYSKSGNEQTIDFKVYRETPLRKNAYLELTVNKAKGVLSWQEISEENISKEIFRKLNDK